MLDTVAKNHVNEISDAKKCVGSKGLPDVCLRVQRERSRDWLA